MDFSLLITAQQMLALMTFLASEKNQIQKEEFDQVYDVEASTQIQETLAIGAILKVKTTDHECEMPTIYTVVVRVRRGYFTMNTGGRKEFLTNQNYLKVLYAETGIVPAAKDDEFFTQSE